MNNVILIGIIALLLLVIIAGYVLKRFYKKLNYSKFENNMIVALLIAQLVISGYDLWISKDAETNFWGVIFAFYEPFVIPLLILAIQSADSQKDKLKLKEIISEQADQQLTAFETILNNNNKKEIEDLENQNQALFNKVTTLEAEKDALINKNKLLNSKLEDLQDEVNLTLEQIRNDYEEKNNQ